MQLFDIFKSLFPMQEPAVCPESCVATTSAQPAAIVVPTPVSTPVVSVSPSPVVYGSIGPEISFLDALTTLFINIGLDQHVAEIIVRFLLLIVMIIVATVALVVLRFVAKYLVNFVTRQMKQSWQEAIYKKEIYSKISYLVVGIILLLMVPMIFSGLDRLFYIVDVVIGVALVVIGVGLMNNIIDSFLGIYNSFAVSRRFPIKGYFQVLKVVLYILAVFIIIAIVFGVPIFYMLGGLSLIIAALAMVFQDSTKGLIAGIELTINNMLSRGDWIQMKEFNVDGEVIDITLTIVQVKNWDKTFVSVPTYYLVSKTFINWRGMRRSGGRRFKKAILVNQKEIKSLTSVQLKSYTKIDYTREYIQQKKAEWQQYSKDHDQKFPPQFTNLELFRNYMVGYMRNHPLINEHMTFMMRNLQPSEYGLPVEIYGFSRDKNWVAFEKVQSEIIDHALVMLEKFGLSVLQRGR